jgi:chromosomal replication initiator protein
LGYLDTLSLFENTEAETITRYDESVAKKVSPDSDALEHWENCLRLLRDNVSTQVYNTWFSPISALKWQDNVLTVLVPSQFFFEWIEEHYYDLLQKTITHVLGEKARLQYEIIVDQNKDSLEERTIVVPAFQHPPTNAQPSLTFKTEENTEKQIPNFLNPRYSFDNFIIGDSNQLAVSAAKAVAGNPGGTSFNPIFIYGGTGLGKTHLVQAIGNYIVKNSPSKKVLNSNAERFTIEFVEAIQNNKVNEFISFYRSIDVLILDDIHVFAGKEKTQDNFFHTFNALHQAGKQIILTSDVPPKELKGVDDRLISRFQWGLNVDIQKPDLEMRMAILKQKSQNEGIHLDNELIEYFAANFKNSVRELEGALINLIAKHTLDKRELDLDLAKEVVKNLNSLTRKEFNINDIKEIVAEHYNIDIEKIESKSRKHEIALARQMSMYLAKRFTNLSLKAIGSHFGGRDHSTVLHSCTAIDNYLSTDKFVRADFEKLNQLCKEASNR